MLNRLKAKKEKEKDSKDASAEASAEGDVAKQPFKKRRVQQ